MAHLHTRNPGWETQEPKGLTMSDLLAMMSGLTPHVPERCLVRETIERATHECPSLRWARGVTFTKTAAGYRRMGTAYPHEHRITINFHGCTSDRDVVETVLHELCHIACYQEGENWKDSSWEFGDRCDRAFAEWNALDGTIHADVVTGGAYQGWHGRRNKIALAARERIAHQTRNYNPKGG